MEDRYGSKCEERRVRKVSPLYSTKRTSMKGVAISLMGHKLTSLMLYSITSSAMPGVGGIVTNSAFAVLRKSAREFVVSERRRSDRKQCRSNPDRPQHKDGYRALPTGTACNPEQYWKKT
jgi:hypothetical protein